MHKYHKTVPCPVGKAAGGARSDSIALATESVVSTLVDGWLQDTARTIAYSV